METMMNAFDPSIPRWLLALVFAASYLALALGALAVFFGPFFQVWEEHREYLERKRKRRQDMEDELTRERYRAADTSGGQYYLERRDGELCRVNYHQVMVES